ncbi:MAG: hypothetical protein ACRCZQ_03705 [Bacteroidales bacterium]
MNNTIKSGLCLLLFLLCLSCSKNFDDRLRGQWQLREYSEGAEQTYPNQVFYKFSRQVLLIESPKAELTDSFFRKEIL